MDYPGALILLFKGSDRNSRLDLSLFQDDIYSVSSLRNKGELMTIPLTNRRVLYIFQAAETLSPEVMKQLPYGGGPWFVEPPFQIDDPRNLQFIIDLIGARGITQFCLLGREGQEDESNQLLFSLQEAHPSAQFFLHPLPLGIHPVSDIPALPLPEAHPPLPLLEPAEIEAEPNEPMEEKVTCVVCQEEILAGMVSLCCCHVQCTDCYARVRDRCPICRASPLVAIDGVFDSDIAYKNDSKEELCGCGMVFKRRDRARHDNEECPNREYTCPGCLHTLPYALLPPHIRDVHKEEVIQFLVRLY